MKKITFSLLIVTIVTLITATILEKLHGTAWVSLNVYSSWWFITLWAALAITGIIYVIQRRLYQRPITLLLHLSFITILIGAAITHYFGTHGQIHLRASEEPKNTFINTYYHEHQLPFSLSLEKFEIIPYPGTSNPMDYVSHIKILDYNNAKSKDNTTNHNNCELCIDNCALYKVSMNNILKYRNYRFYQSSYDADRQGTILSVYHDPYGITITYIGYFLLFISMTLFLFNRFISYIKSKNTKQNS